MANVLITGCSSGFGLLTARQFARKGDTVFATMRDLAKARALEAARDAEKLDNIKILPLDVLDDASVTKAVAEASKAGPIDVLVNNAGWELRSPVEEASDDEVRRQFDTNVFGTLRLIRAVLPAMRERGSGTIVNLSSIAGIVAPPYGGFYAASKHAIEAISEALHYEVGPLGVRVIVIEPGGFATEFRNNIVHAGKFNERSPYWERAERFDAAVRGITAPGGQSGDPEDVAIAIYNAVHDTEAKLRYLVGNDAQMIAGVRKQLDFESFERAMRQTMNWHD
jgi:NAD(P)-dependent dehydrogenase (short-subunit alcohol dehydrogenase family)